MKGLIRGWLHYPAEGSDRWLGGMNRYKTVKKLGDGTYGSVVKAVNKQTGELVPAAAGRRRRAGGRWQSRS